jgi:hypothetical protein
MADATARTAMHTVLGARRVHVRMRREQVGR